MVSLLQMCTTNLRILISFLPFKSCHPRHTKNNIPYSQAIRLCTIIDDPIVKEERLAEMKEYFLACGIPKNTHRKRNQKGQIHTSTRTPQNKAEDKGRI